MSFQKGHLLDPTLRHLEPLSGATMLRESQKHLDALSPEDRLAWQNRLERLEKACGCAEGAIGLITGTVGALLYLSLQPGGLLKTGWWEILFTVPAVLAAGIIGKIFGLRRARTHFHRAVAELKRLVQSREISS